MPLDMQVQEQGHVSISMWRLRAPKATQWQRQRAMQQAHGRSKVHRVESVGCARRGWGRPWAQ